MRWPWGRRGPSPADKALAESRKEREAVQAKSDEIRTLAYRLRQLRYENHFAENIRRALGEGP